MATFTSFVSENYLKEFTPISRNVDITEIVPFLEETELINTRELLGKPLYDDLKTKFINQTLSSDEITLVNLIKKSIAYRASELCLPFLNFKIVGKGPQKLRGEFSDPASLEDMKYIRHELKNYAEYHEERVVDYLTLNGSIFPLYNTSDNEEGIISTNDTRYDSDIYLGDYNDLRINKYLYGKGRSI